MEAHLAPRQPIQVNKITSSCEIFSGPHDTQYYMEISNKPLLIMHPRISTKQEVSGTLSNSSKTILVTLNLRLFKFEADLKQQQSEMNNKIDTVLKAITDRIAGALPSDTIKNPKLNVNSTTSILSACSYPIEDPQWSTHIHGNFTYVMDFIIIEDISPIIDPRLSQVVLEKPFVEISKLTHDPLEGVVRFTNGIDEITYEIPHKIEQYNSLSDLEKEHTKLVYLRNEEDKRRGVEWKALQGERLIYIKSDKAISLGDATSKVAGQRKPEGQWTADERKAANLDQQLKSLIMPSDVKESRAMDLKLCCNTFKFKEGESLTQTFIGYKAMMNELVNYGIKLSNLEINTGFINGLPKKWLSFCQSLRNTNLIKDSELAFLFGKNKGLISKTYDWDDEQVSSDENEGTKVKALMALTDEEKVLVGK
nr:retrovirus-related Pol polyprotein from transposon TNT 1-94 [Tanacetum cinerariifolium]